MKKAKMYAKVAVMGIKQVKKLVTNGLSFQSEVNSDDLEYFEEIFPLTTFEALDSIEELLKDDSMKERKKSLVSFTTISRILFHFEITASGISFRFSFRKKQ